MKEEFNLSKKQIRMQIKRQVAYFYDQKNVKEFIRIIESDYQKEWDKATENNSVIDKNKLKEILIKRAGEKLK